jgi:hypothetical protein
MSHVTGARHMWMKSGSLGPSRAGFGPLSEGQSSSKQALWSPQRASPGTASPSHLGPVCLVLGELVSWTAATVPLSLASCPLLSSCEEWVPALL